MKEHYIITTGDHETQGAIHDLFSSDPDYANLVFLPWTSASKVGWIIQASLTQEEASAVLALGNVTLYKEQ